MVRNAQKRGKREMHTVGPGIWRETLKIMENEKCTLQNLEYGRKSENHGKCEAYTLQDLEYVEKTEKRGKLETHMVGPERWRESLKNVQNEKPTMQDLEHGEKQRKT